MKFFNCIQCEDYACIAGNKLCHNCHPSSTEELCFVTGRTEIDKERVNELCSKLENDERTEIYQTSEQPDRYEFNITENGQNPFTLEETGNISIREDTWYKFEEGCRRLEEYCEDAGIEYRVNHSVTAFSIGVLGRAVSYCCL